MTEFHYVDRKKETLLRPDLENLENLPLMSRKDFREQYPDRMCYVSRGRIAEMHMSSGSTGIPAVMLYTAGDVNQWAECMDRCYRMGCGCRGCPADHSRAGAVPRRFRLFPRRWKSGASA